MNASPEMTRHELSQAILADNLTKFTDRALEALEEIAHVDMEQLPTAESIAAWEKVNAEIGRRSHPFETFKYADGSEREILSGRTGKDGKWYAFPVCAREGCGLRRSAKAHR